MELKIGGNMGVLLVFCLAIHCLGTVGAKRVTELEFTVDRNYSETNVVQETFLSCLCGAEIPHGMSCKSNHTSSHHRQRFTHCLLYSMDPKRPHVKCTMRTPHQCKKREDRHCKPHYDTLDTTGYCFDECVEMHYRLTVLRGHIQEEPIERECRIRHTLDYHPRKRGWNNPSASEVNRIVRNIRSDSTLAWALVGIFFLALMVVSGLLVFVWWRGIPERRRRASDMAMLFNRNDERLAVGNTGST